MTVPGLVDPRRARRGVTSSTSAERAVCVTRHCSAMCASCVCSIRAALGDDPIDLRRLGAADVIQFVSATDRPVLSSVDEDRRHRACGRSSDSSAPRGVGDERLDAAIPPRRPLAARRRCRAASARSSSRRCSRRRSAASPCARTGPRDRAAASRPWGSGPGEVAALQLEDIDWRAGTIHLRTRKTRRGARAAAAARRRPRDRRLPAPRSARDRGAPGVRAASRASSAGRRSRAPSSRPP